MRSDKLVTIVGEILLAALVVMFFGCGSNDKSTGSTVNYNDPEFTAVRGEVDLFIDSTLEFFTNGLDNIHGLATDTSLVNPILYVPGPIDLTTDSVSATYSGGWHVVYIALNRSAFVSILRDSIQFLKNGQPQQSSSGLDDLFYKQFWTYRVNDTTVTHESFAGNADYWFSGLNTSQATISGSNVFSVYSKFVSTDSTVWQDINIDATLSGIRVKKNTSGWAQSCPNSGSIAATVEMLYQKGSAAPDTTNWTVSLTFNNGNVSSIITRGTTVWSYNEQICTPPGN